jgi:chromosome segregation ATPase
MPLRPQLRESAIDKYETDHLLSQTALAEKVPSWLERLLLPQISEIKGEIKAFRGETEGELKSINTRIGSLSNEVNTRIETLSTQINTRIDSLSTEIKDLRESISVAQRLAVLEAEVNELRKQTGG